MFTVKTIREAIKANPTQQFRIAACSQMAKTLTVTCEEASGSSATFVDATGERYIISKGNFKFISLSK